MTGRGFWSAPLPAPLKAAISSVHPGLLSIAAASALVNLLMLVGPIFMLLTYDRVLPSRSVPTLIGLLLIALVLLIVQAVVDMLRSRLLARTAEAFDEAVREDVFDSVHHAAMTHPNSDGLQVMRDLDTVRGFIAGSGLIAVCDLPWTPLYVVICMLFHPLMGLAVAGAAIALALITFAAETFTRRPAQSLVALATSRRNAAETAFRHADVVHALGMKWRMADLWSEKSQNWLDVQRVTFDLTAAFGSASRFLRMVLQSGVLALGAYLVIDQQATAGVMLAATILSIRALAPIELAIANWRGFIAARASFQRLREAFAAMPPKQPATPLPAPHRDLRVTAVSLTAPRSEILVLHEASFSLQAGSAVAIVGPSGSGKSTLARALVGVGAPVRGVIRIDGASLAQWDPLSLGPSIGYLPQDVALLRGTVAQNISRFAAVQNATDLIAAAKAADVHDLILRLPNGYETEVGDDGLMLSGGQRQRIGLARALYGNPFLVVLDEPDANLDTEGQRALARAITAVRARGGIVAIVAHGIHLLKLVDHMLVLNEGRVQAFGRTEAVLPMLLPKPQAPSAPAPRANETPRRSRKKQREAVSANE